MAAAKTARGTVSFSGGAKPWIARYLPSGKTADPPLHETERSGMKAIENSNGRLLNWVRADRPDGIVEYIGSDV